MKKVILKKLNSIAKFATSLDLSGTVKIYFNIDSNCTLNDFDKALSEIVEYPRSNHFVSVTDKLTVMILTD